MSKSPSPTKTSTPNLPPPNSFPSLLNPPSPRTHRALRRLQSAHTLGQSNHQPSLISQQHRQVLERTLSPANTPSLPHHTRGRSNSDASNMTPTSSSSRKGPMSGKRPVAADALSLDRLIRDGPPDGDLIGALESMRLKILDQGIKSDSDGMSSLRIYAWIILLNAPVLPTDDYLALIHRGASPAYSKIRNDTFRTLATDPLFRRRVSEASLIRLLNAIAWKLHDAKEAREESQGKVTHTANIHGSPELQSGTTPMRARARAATLTANGSEAGKSEAGTYVQGMNVLAAPFLYAARSEAEAFVGYHHLITKEVPSYVRGAMTGVHAATRLVDKVLAIVDPKLSQYLIVKNHTAQVYGFASILTLCACTPPLPEVLRLWDFLFAYGAHLNVLCIVAQLIMMRKNILSDPNPNIRSFPPLKSEEIKEITLSLIKKIPDDVYAEIVAHVK